VDSTAQPKTRRARLAPQRRRRRFFAAITASLTVLGLSLGAVLVGTAPAQAASYGYGQDWFGFWHGSYLENGVNIYCLDPAGVDPIGVGPASDSQTATFGSLSGNQLAGLAWLASTVGQTTDNQTATIVNDAIWIVTSGYATGAPWAAQAYAYAAQVNAYTAAAGSGSMGLTMQANALNNYLGTVTVSSVSTGSATGTITLTNGVFVSSGTSTLAGTFSAGQSFAIRGVPPVNVAAYKIGAAFIGTAAGSTYGPSFRLMTYGGAYQPMIAPSSPATIPVSGSALDPADRAVAFAPAATTTVGTALAETGDPLTDVVTPIVIANSGGLVNEWFRAMGGVYVPITYRGAIWRTDAPLADGDPIPADAELITDSLTFTTAVSTTDPTTVPVTVTGPNAPAPGYYTWVWSVDDDDQTLVVRTYALEADYQWSDTIRVSETTTVAQFAPTATTTVAATVVAPGTPLVDVVTPRIVQPASGVPNAWHTTGSTYATVTYRGAIWRLDEPLADGDPIPADAELITDALTLTVGGTDVSPVDVGVPVTGPIVTEAGHYLWVWSLAEADQTPESLVLLADGYAWVDPERDAETTTLAALRTTATTSAIDGGSIRDTAHITGILPTGGAALDFAVYRVPTVADPDDATAPATVDYPTGVLPGDYSWACTAGNQVFTSSTLTVTAPGDIESDPFTPSGPGLYLWVATLSAGGAEPIAGTCGDPDETSTIVQAATRAQTSDATGAEPQVWDTATIAGFVPDGATLVFEAYRLSDLESPTCDAQSFVEATDPVSLPEGLYTGTNPLAITGDKIQLAPVFAGTQLYWVHSLRDADGRELHRGACGDPLETIRIAAAAAALAHTGDAGLKTLLWSAWIVAIGFLLLTASAWGTRRRRAALG